MVYRLFNEWMRGEVTLTNEERSDFSLTAVIERKCAELFTAIRATNLRFGPYDREAGRAMGGCGILSIATSGSGIKMGPKSKLGSQSQMESEAELRVDWQPYYLEAESTFDSEIALQLHHQTLKASHGQSAFENNSITPKHYYFILLGSDNAYHPVTSLKPENRPCSLMKWPRARGRAGPRRPFAFLRIPRTGGPGKHPPTCKINRRPARLRVEFLSLSELNVAYRRGWRKV
ncbi:hypothetical protein EVAR_40820_1 [Eumeta japonica]|uniref:Uncharacterized protein n=1 Tax=Eumeta variegata TaxID=151549 RepID=A0A4C1WFY2_EUMVA|nr:hypothetical protein EVAR_40820_1 [Eumeta japonica]